MPSDFSPKDPNCYVGAFTPITLELQSSTENSSLILGLVKEQAALYFVIRKRFPEWVEDICLDSLRLSDAVKRLGLSAMSYPHSFKDEILRVAFENFVMNSPFSAYVREHLNQWDAAQFFNELRAIAPDLNIMQPRRKANEQGSGHTRIQEVS